MIDVLVTGGNGQLGNSLKRISGSYKEFVFTYIDIDDLDLSNQAAVSEYFEKHHFNYIINCAAFTAVDLAEKEPEKAYLINASVPEWLGLACAKQPAYLIHFSTDYVYNGAIGRPHSEDDIPLPGSVYAQSKLEGEKVLWQNPKAMVIRTSWLYSEYGKNFVKTMLNLFREKKDVHVVYDQVGTPTYAGDLADAVLQMIRFCEKNTFMPGVYNYSNTGVCSWFDFARAIMTLSKSLCRIHPVRTTEINQTVHRPEYSVMDKRKIQNTFSLNIPYWRDSLQIALRNLDV